MRWIGKAATMAGLFAVCLMASASPDAAKPSRRTLEANQLALDAVLSMPASPPYNEPWPESGANPQNLDEETVIEQLADLRKQGADFTTYRHQGTVLLHAIRIGLNHTAVWLLQHGAPPLQQVADGAEGTDAVTLAIRFQRWPVLDALVKLPTLASRLDASQASRNYGDAYRLYAPEPDDDRRAIAALLARHIALPQGDDAQCFMRLALQRQMLDFALALPADRPRTIAAEADIHAPAWHAVCSPTSVHGDTLPLSALSTKQLEQLDRKLASPLFPWLLASVNSPDDITRLFSLPIRQPTDAVAVAAVLAQLDQTKTMPNKLRGAIIAKLPAAYTVAYHPVRDTGPDESTVTAWMASNAKASPEAFAAALSTLRPALWHAKAGEMLGYFKASRPDAIHWSVLLKHLPAEVVATEFRYQLNDVPLIAWPDLLAAGYQLRESEVASWLRSAKPDDIEHGFPLLAARWPALRHGTLLALTKPWALRCDEDRGLRPDDVARIQALLRAGAAIDTAPVLHRECARQSKPEVVQALLATGAMKPPTVLSSHRFVRLPNDCRIDPSEALFDALRGQVSDTHGLAEPIQPERVQAIAIPGQVRCGVLASSGFSFSRMWINDEDFYDGTESHNPCADGNPLAALWSAGPEGIARTPLANGLVNDVVSVRDTTDGTSYVAVLPVPQGCTARDAPARLLAWKRIAGQPPALEDVPGDADVLDAFLQQCSAKDSPLCAQHTGDTATGAVSPQRMLDQVFAQRRQDWLDAVMRMDKPALAVADRQGVAAHWLFAAFARVTTADLSLADKRARMAWLLRNHERTRAAAHDMDSEGVDTQSLRGLLDWLPDEDWPTLLTGFEGMDDALGELQRDANEKKRTYLACTISLQRGHACDNASAP